ncbi:SdpI family protein [Candidatus Parcubacteria bacterium]|nr:MAG: SdpI family protein [Candidatus Parcubacteria bacterium]
MPNPIKLSFKTEILPIALLLTSLVASFYFYANFPEQVPTHWNYRGEIDDYSPKTFAAFFFPALNAGLYLLFLAIPYIDPKKDRYVEFSKVYHIFKDILIAVLTLIYFYVGLAGMGYDLSINYIIPPAIGILFMVMGNYMGKIKSNWFFGIRTPWTLSSEEVWNKTHRLGGKLFMLLGLFLILGAFLPNQQLYWIIFMAGIVIIALVPIIYSYWLYKKVKSNNSKTPL